ncbi:hypothetical protein JCM10450v2_001669 [Rhodotorula kratochvilovae]
MPAKRTKTAVYASPARKPTLRARKRQKTGHSTSALSLSQRLDSDGDDRDAAERTDSDYEDLVEHDRDAASGRRRRTSAPAAGGSGASSSSRAASSRRSSLASLRTAGAARGRLAPRARGREDPAPPVTQHRTTRGARTQQPLSPLPVNHAVERQARAPNGKGKERARDEDDVAMLAEPSARRGSAPPVEAQPQGGRVTRRSSGSFPPVQAEHVPMRPRRRASWATTGDGSEDEQERADDGEGDAGQSRGRLRRKTVLADISDAGEAADAEGGEEESPDASDTGEGNDIETKLQEWDVHHLEALLKTELVDLYHRAYPATSSSHSAPRTKAELAQAIVDARYDSHSASGESDVDDEGDDSPHPRTSHEGSPADGFDTQRGSRRRSTPRKKVLLRRSGVRGQEPTPPPSDGSRDGDASGGATEVDEPADAGGARMTRRASQVEMPPPPLPPAGGARRHMRTRSSTSGGALPASGPKKVAIGAGSPRPQRTRVQFGDAVAEAQDEGGATPVAHRTRHHAPSAEAPALAPGSPRPLRAAKKRAVARLTKGEKGKGRADGDGASDEDEDDEMADGADVLVLGDPDSDDGTLDFEGDSSIEFIDAWSLPAPAARQAKKAGGAGGRRRSARTAKQVETPPSHADEESGGETERGGAEEEHLEARSHLRQAGRPLRNGRLVKLQKGKERAAPHGDEDEQMGEADDDDEEEGDDSFRLEHDDDEEHDDDNDIDLAHATSTTLMRYKKDDLVRLCEERDLLDNENRTKPQLIDALLQWRDKTSEMSSPVSSPRSSSSTISNLSTKTAREETKTQALRGLEHASARTSAGTPLLMRADHSASPEKPRTPEHSKEHEHQEDVNALDLESLQLRDKEIQPEELTKLERVGSGGFKDVYKGMLDGRTIAICDIRGHLTDMDIKELGLLRDLRHKNIVKFIGVSIPKQPSPVPVMIITELCANGDLFDYIRKVAPPPFTTMLEIMLGISRGIEYLHKRKPTIIHRDIKSSNVLITGEGVPKIADFGLARIKTSTKSMIRSLVGTVNWQAPELWSPHPRYNEKVDVYSVALVFWEILQWHQPVKRYPFEGQNEHAIYHDVGAKQLRPPAGPLRRQWGSEIIDLMTEMWEQDPALRPSMSKVVSELQRLIAAEKAKERATKRG